MAVRVTRALGLYRRRYEPPTIAAAVEPATLSVVAGDTAADALPASATDTANYSSTAGAIVSAVATYTLAGSGISGATVLPTPGELLDIVLTVTDDQANERIWTWTGQVVLFPVPAPLTIPTGDVDVAMTPIDIDAAAGGYGGVVTLDPSSPPLVAGREIAGDLYQGTATEATEGRTQIFRVTLGQAQTTVTGTAVVRATLALPATLDWTVGGDAVPQTRDFDLERIGGQPPITWTEVSNDVAGVTHSAGELTAAQTDKTGTVVLEAEDNLTRTAQTTISVTVTAGTLALGEIPEQSLDPGDALSLDLTVYATGTDGTEGWAALGVMPWASVSAAGMLTGTATNDFQLPALDNLDFFRETTTGSFEAQPRADLYVPTGYELVFHMTEGGERPVYDIYDTENYLPGQWEVLSPGVTYNSVADHTGKTEEIWFGWREIASGENHVIQRRGLIEFSAGGAGDTTPATLTSPGQTDVSTDEIGGTIYRVTIPPGTAPSADQVIAGTDASDVAAEDAASTAASSIGAHTLAFSTITYGVDRVSHYTQVDAAGNQSAVVSSATFQAAQPSGLTLDEFSRDKTIFDSGAHLRSCARKEVLRLKKPAETGSTWTAAYKIPGIDTPPTGMTYNAAARRVELDGTFSGWLEGWNFEDTASVLWTSGSQVRMRDCRIGAPNNGLDVFFYVVIEAGAEVVEISRNTLTGPNAYSSTFVAAIQRQTSGSGLSVTSAGEGLIARNRFLNLPSDGLKWAGGTFEENYVKYDRNLDEQAFTWQSGTTYSTGDLVRGPTNNGHIWRSKTNGNQGNEPPSTKSGSSSFWENLDPHVDAITIPLVVPGSVPIVRRNLIDMRADEFASVVNNAIRSVPNSGTNHAHESVLITENILLGKNAASFPMESSDNGNTNFEPDTIAGNWIGANANGKYVRTAGAPAGSIWLDNWDIHTDLLIPTPTNYSPSFEALTRFSRAQVPLTGTASPGAVIEARAPSVDDGGASSSPWQEIATADGSGNWSGTLEAQRNTSWYRVEVRLQAAPATVVTSSRRFAAGHVWARWSQSDEYHIYAFTGSITPPTVIDDDALQVVFMLRGYLDPDPQDPGTAFLERVTDATVNIPGFATMSNACNSIAPGEKFLIALHSQSGNGVDERVNEVDGRRHKADEQQIHDLIVADGTQVGVVHEFFSSGTPRNLIHDAAMGPIQFGINPDGSGFTPGGGATVPLLGTGTQRVDWTLDEFYDWSHARWGFSAAAASSSWQTARQRMEAMAEDPVYRDFFLADPSWGLTSRSWMLGENNGQNDTPHPAGDDIRGSAQAAWVQMGTLAGQAGLLPGGRPVINTIELHPNGNQKAVALGWTGGPVSTTRLIAGRARIDPGNNSDKYTDLLTMGWNGTDITRAEIADDTGALASEGRIWIYKPDGSDWTSGDIANIDLNDWGPITKPGDVANGWQFDDRMTAPMGSGLAGAYISSTVVPSDLLSNHTAYPPDWHLTRIRGEDD